MVFFSDRKRYLDTGNISDALAGNAPIIVNRGTGEVVQTGTSNTVDHYNEQYERRLRSK